MEQRDAAILAQFDEYTIEDKGGDVMPFVVYGWRDHAEDSVLAGTRRKSFLECFETEELARAAFPTALDGTRYRGVAGNLSHLPDTEEN
ncbi:hypothetical protein [Burkholderia ubonensis]|uniref:Uncharacterized protein n=1 Tax=Burkholderia ubonensis TaxID=101571 RepID=A0ABD4DZ78_9BURK|nr:hypothetical protein [Burkholderia ubonensis]KVN83411.1 hypothetical protein WJ68_15970 [Burkholderia ubonensis]